MLAIFTFAYIINAINYANEEAKVPLLALGLALLFLLLAFFTKETAVFAPPVAFVLILMGLGQSWNSNRMYALYGSAVVAFTIWYIARHNATIAVTPIKPMEMLTSFVGRLGLIIQYLGKIVCPANLSVFPIQQDTTYFIGIPAIALLIALAYMNKDRQWKQILTASAVFFLFLLPALLVPNTLNEQAFEHRLYLPMLGVLLFLPQTVVFQKLSSVELSRYFGIYCLALIVVNFVHQRNFRNPPVFWNQAVATSPHSAYANMMLGARIENLEGNTGTKEEKLQQSYKLFRTAYALNPKEKYLGYYYGRMLQLQDSTLESEKHLLAEKKLSGYYECDFYLARVAVMKHDTAGAIKYIENFLKTDTASQPGNQNLLLMYMQTGRRTEAESLAVKMQRMHIPLPGAK